jgi:hypothetical protein
LLAHPDSRPDKSISERLISSPEDTAQEARKRTARTGKRSFFIYPSFIDYVQYKCNSEEPIPSE